MGPADDDTSNQATPKEGPRDRLKADIHTMNLEVIEKIKEIAQKHGVNFFEYNLCIIPRTDPYNGYENDFKSSVKVKENGKGKPIVPLECTPTGCWG